MKTDSKKEWEGERAFGGLMVTFAVADGVTEFQEMSTESSKTNPQGKTNSLAKNCRTITKGAA